MPANKSPSYRHRIIDECLRNRGRKWKLEDLISVVSERMRNELWKDKGISKRMIQYDLQLMKRLKPEGFEAPIVCKDGFYFYANSEFSIYNLPIHQDDIMQLKQAIAALQQFRGLHFFEELEPVINRLESKIETNAENSFRIIEFEQRPETKGSEHLGDLYKSIQNKTVLKISYKPFGAEQLRILIFHPYLLKEYSNRWYLFGLDEVESKMKSLALDRMENIKVSGNKFIVNRFVNFNDYFKNIIGVTLPLDGKVEKVEFRVANDRAPYISTKPFHWSQQLTKTTKTYTTFVIDIIINKELISVFLSFGKDLEVVRPIELRKTMKNIFKAALSGYV